MSVLSILIGVSVDKVVIVHDYWQIYFTNQSILNIYNNYNFTGENIENLVGEKILSIDELTEKIDLSFTSNLAVSISLKDQDYNGPEAVTFHKDSDIWVWS